MTRQKAYDIILKSLIQKDYAKYLLCGVLGISKEDYMRHQDFLVTDQDMSLLKDAVQRHNQGEPLSKIVGKREFWGMDFKVTKDTLDPRPDTETLIELTLESLPQGVSYTFLELGVGTGCLIISLLKEYAQASGVGVDISPKALEVAKENSRLQGIENRLTLIQSSWFENVEGRYDLIISNPPYIPHKTIENLDISVKDHDPHLALDGGEDGLDPYRIIAQTSEKYLNPHGSILLEIGFGQALDVEKIFHFHGFKLSKMKKDLSGIDRAMLFKRP